MTNYADVKLFINGEWRNGSNEKSEPIINPATGTALARLAHASRQDLDQALAAAEAGFQKWRRVSAFERAKVLRRAGEILRSRVDQIAETMTLEQGKPLAESKIETMNAADVMDWFAEEARRAYGRIIPSRFDGVTQIVVKEPVGPVAAFTPWNFPINQAVRKLSAALAAGCSVIIKGPEETPGSCAALLQAYHDAGVPAGVLNLVFGIPAEISEYLIPHPLIKKVTFTGSTPVGKKLAALAGEHMKRVTMELGGHAPAIVFDDADIGNAVKVLAAAKFRNAGQVCISPTRFLIQDSVYSSFVDGFVSAAAAVKVGDGLAAGTTMGPLANSRRVEAMEALVADAREKGAKVLLGGKRLPGNGYFFEPTVLTDVPMSARIMQEEPFGPVVPIARFSTFAEAVTEANRLPWGLAAFAHTRSLKTAQEISAAIESGMVAVNNAFLGLPETPFGGVKDSGYGSEGGSEAIEMYLNTKFITQTSL